ncbi:MAG: 2-phospho-L-lactate guanylyltransferase [Herbiconiux sp.]|nr:2-phospho-L-lactate guanylyltransferase [Herbiconiux sp.]
MTAVAPGWTIVVPVKGTAAGKSRLAPDVPAGVRERFATAFALDAVTALLGAVRVTRVVVVTDAGADAIGPLRRLGAEVVPDPGGGLNAAIEAGLATVPVALPRAVLLGDLPRLVPADVDAALEEAARHPLALVPDAQGSGTTLITARGGLALTPRFGAGSAARHLAGGHVVLDVPVTSTLRQDVDTPADLAAALAAGVGSFTRAEAERSLRASE